VPLEVSLCHLAARPLCSVEHGVATLEAAQRYKATTECSGHTQPAAMETTTEPPAASFADALAAMDPAHRVLVSAAFGDMDAKMTELNNSNGKSQQRVTELETASAVDKSLLKQQISQFLSQISNETRARYAMGDTEAVSDTLCGNNADSMRRTVDKLLMCCSSVMFNNRSPPAAPTAKRTQEEANILTTPISTIPEQPEQPVPFEPSAQSASDQLRNALSAFHN